MDVVCRVVEVDGILETDASGETGQNTQAQEEDNRNFGVAIELNGPQERNRPSRFILVMGGDMVHATSTYSNAQNQSVKMLTAVSA
jgi:hypothetical protein